MSAITATATTYLESVPICEATVVSFDRSYFIGTIYDMFVEEVNIPFVDENDESYKCDFEHVGNKTTEKMVLTIRCWNREMCRFVLNIKKQETRNCGIEGYKYTINAALDYVSEMEFDSNKKRKFESDLKHFIQYLKRECEDHDEELFEREYRELQQDYDDGKC